MKTQFHRFNTLAVLGTLFLSIPTSTFAFDVDRSPNPPDYAAEEPASGEVVTVNPPSLVWRIDDRAASYIVELSPDANFKTGVVRTEGVKFPFYNHSSILAPGTWHWRYFVVDAKGETSTPGPTRSFVVNASAVKMPVPPMSEILAKMPEHPRIFVTPATLKEFRARRNGPAKDAWDVVREQADKLLDQKPQLPVTRVPLAEAIVALKKIPTPGISGWKAGDPTRRQVFWVDKAGTAFWMKEYKYNQLNSDANKAQTLAYAYLISGDAKYAEAARRWLDFVSEFRLDYHLDDLKKRAAHDTASYAYEQGLKDFALAYDHVYDHLSPEQRQKALAHVEYHAEAAVEWLKAVKIEVRYQQSHPQQTMHNTLTALLAVAKDSPKSADLASWVVPQYMNRIAWTSPDGGYFEGQTYGHKFRWILEGLTAIRTATGVDLFQKPEVHNSGAYWLYAMDLNYWYQHYGDIYSLLTPSANGADAYIAGLMAEMTQDPYVKWYSQTVLANPDHIPFRYLSEGPLQAKPPIDIPQARAFLETGVVSAYDEFWNHNSNRLFFRSSPWGAHSHSHADQNGFIIHSNGEILAPDTGYYTYSGDTYNKEWSKGTFSHNSLLVNGKGQPTNIDSKGRIANFFNGGNFTYFVGDASKAYEAPLQTFRRAMLFVRPNVYVVYDELAAGQPSTYSWLLNTFSKPEIDQTGQRMIVPQQNERLQVDHLLPRGMTYTTTNERPYPIKTRAWSRITEAFPQAWHTRANTPAKSDERILTLMQTYDVADGAKTTVSERFENETSVGLKINDGAGRDGIVLFRRQLNGTQEVSGGGVLSDGQATALFLDRFMPAEWMLSNGRRLSWNNTVLAETQNEVSLSGNWSTPAAAAVVRFVGAPGEIKLALNARPQQVLLSSSETPSDARPINFDFQNGTLTTNITSNGTLTTNTTSNGGVLWIDPKVNLTAAIPDATLTVKDSQGSYNVPLRGAWSQTGNWVYFAQTDAREPGTYSFHWIGISLSPEKATPHLLVQDIWEPTKTARGQHSVTGTFREGSELYFTVEPSASAPKFNANLQNSARGQLMNLLRNGDFEEGIENYPPRKWSLQKRSSSSEDLGWGAWSQEDKHGGKSSLRFLRVGDPRTLTSQPLRLRTAGEYHIRFFAKGDADNASVRVVGAGGRALDVPIQPGSEWREYQAKVDLLPGYTTVQVLMESGKKNAVLWLDDMQLGRIAQ